MLPRLLGATLIGALLLASMPAHAFAPSPAEIERIYSEGEKKNSEGDFKGAAQSWTRLMVLLQEESKNQATRETLLINVLDAHINAYNRLPGPDGKKDIANLREGKKTYELYLQQHRAVYGEDRALSAAVQQKADELESALKKAEEDLKGPVVGPDPVPDPDIDKDKDKDKDKDVTPIVLPPENNGTGLIVGGAVAAGLGFGALGILIAGAIGAPRAEEDYEIAQNNAQDICNGGYPDNCTGLTTEQQQTLDGYEQDIDDADKRGRTANALTITGAVLTPVLLGAGAAMLAIGIKRNREARSSRTQLNLSPAYGRGFAGFVLRGRF